MDFRDFLSQPLFTIGSTETTVGMALAAAVVVIVTFVLARMARRITVRHFERHEAGDKVAVKTASNLIALAGVVVGLDIVLNIFGVRLTALFAAGGFFGLGAGFAVKNILENFLSGVILRVDQTIRKGDVVQLHDRLLQITRLGLRSTVGTTVDGEEILIPNSTVAGGIVANLTRKNRVIRVPVRVGVDLTSDLEVVREALEKAAAGLDWKSKEGEPMVLVKEFTRNSMDYEVSVWIDDVLQLRQRHSDLSEAIWRELSAAGVTMA
jgi:small-conductance mechanosensitive channel